MKDSIMSNDKHKWAKDFKETLENSPEVGAILTTLSDKPAKLTAELKEGAPPFVFGRAYVPGLLGEPLGWYLRDADDNSYHGYRCVLLPRARTEIIRKIGLGELNADESESVLLVKSLKVVRYSNSRNSILCEVHEYWAEEEKPPLEEVVEPPASMCASEEKENDFIPAIAILDEPE